MMLCTDDPRETTPTPAPLTGDALRERLRARNAATRRALRERLTPPAGPDRVDGPPEAV
jgi:hypothetical protein